MQLQDGLDKENSGFTISPSTSSGFPDHEGTILEKHDESYSVAESFIVSYSNDTKINEWLVYSNYIKHDFKI
jgi:hypothetical protein